MEEDPERKALLFVRLKEEMMKNIVPLRTLPGSPRSGGVRPRYEKWERKAGLVAFLGVCRTTNEPRAIVRVPWY
jgi:hypothetical protein